MYLPDAIDFLRPSVVQIQGVGEDPPGRVTLGTGFIVSGKRFVVTAKHVVDAVGYGRTLEVGFAGPEIDTPELQMRANFIATQGQVIATSAEHDLALIEVPGAEHLRPIVVAHGINYSAEPKAAQLFLGPVREGVDLAVSGYPLRLPSLVTTAGPLASAFSPDESGTEIAVRLLGDFTANPGNSGGPVYRVRDGAVIGVLIAGRLTPVVGGVGHHAAGLSIIVPATEVAGLMMEHGLEVAEPAPRAKSPNKKRRR